MIEGGIGGTNTQTGLIFEEKVDLATFLSNQNRYFVNENSEVFYNNELVAQIFKKNKFYEFLEKMRVNWTNIISKKILPDDSIYVFTNNTFFIIEYKFQKVSGSVDEKLQTCDFKKKQYQKLLHYLNVEHRLNVNNVNIEYIYLLSNWFKQPSYKDVLEYINSVGCWYFFEYIPLQFLGLPVPSYE